MKLVIIYIFGILATSQLNLGIQRITCPAGTTLKPKQNYKPVPNGCGATDAQVNLGISLNPFTPILVPCCIAHDNCYGTCDQSGNTAKSFRRCNNQFIQCLSQQCEKQANEKKRNCHIWASAYFGLVKNLGGRYYTHDQVDACECR